MKKILICGVVVIGVVAVAGAVAVNYLLDGETIAQELKKEAKSRLNRDLTFAGLVDIKLFPKIAVQLPATSLSYVNSDKPQLSLNSASVGVMVLPLLKGEVKLDAIKIDGLKGKVNLERLKAALDKKQVEAATGETTVQTKDTKGGLSFIKDFSVHGIDVFNSALTVYGLPDKKVYALENVNLSTGALAMKGETSVRFSADFSEKTGKLKGNVGVDAQLVYDLPSVALSLEKFAGHASLDNQGQEVKVQLTAPKVAYLQGDIETQGVKLSLVAPNETKVDASMKLSSTGAMTLWRLDDLKGDAKVLVGQKVRNVPFAGKAMVQTNTETVAATLTGELEKAPFAVQLQSVGFAKPGVTGSVTLDRFTVDDWIGNTQSDKKVAVTNGVISTAWADESTDLSVLNMADANVAFKIGSVKYQGLEVKPVTANILLQKGKLSMQNAKAGVCGGTITAALSLDASARWNVNAQTNNVNSQCVANGLGVAPMLEGIAVAKVGVSGIGIDSSAIKKTANGTMTANVQNAQLRGLSLEKIATAVREKAIAGLIVSKDDLTALETLSLNASVKNGELCVMSLKGKSSVAEVSGQAKVGLLTEQLSGKVMAKMGTSIDGRRVIVPITLSGTVTEPAYQLDLATLVKEQVKEELTNPELLLKGLNKLLKR